MNESDNNEETLDDYLAKLNLERGRMAWKKRRKRILNIFKRIQPDLKKDMNICEIGLGEGYFLKLLYLKGYRNLTGLDISRYLIRKLRHEFQTKKYKIKLVKQDISKPLDRSMKFDVVVCLDILEHIENIKDAINNIIKILKKKGLLFLTLPWKEDILNNMVTCPYCKKEFHPIGHFHSFNSIEDIKKILNEKFQIEERRFCKPVDLNIPNKIYYFLKKTLLRSFYYKRGKPKYPSTIFIKARRIS